MMNRKMVLPEQPDLAAAGAKETPFEAVAGVLFCFVEGDDFGVVEQVVFVPAFADDLAGAVEDDAADGGVGRAYADAAAS